MQIIQFRRSEKKMRAGLKFVFVQVTSDEIDIRSVRTTRKVRTFFMIG